MTENNNKKFAQRFKDLRVEKGYTQQQLANLFNVTRPCICYWETGKRVPDYIKLVEVCKFFNVSSDYLLGMSDIKSKSFNEGKVVYDIENYLDISCLSDEYKRQLIDFYEYLSEKQKRIVAESKSKL